MVGLHSFPINSPGTVFYGSKKATDTMRKEVQQLIKEKKDAMSIGIQSYDIMSHMILSSNPVAGRFKLEKEIASFLSALVVSGFTTPATTLAIIMKYLAERPDIYDKIHAEQMEISSSKKLGELLNWEDIQKMKYTWHAALKLGRVCDSSTLHLRPGKEYSRLVMLIFLHNLVKNFKWEVLAPNENITGTVIPIPGKGFPILLQPLST
ncbi:beta-amyrin 28-monooxygenase-like [Cornus florida]|uniref:beta-amyrin 28-monooxygenase-like n=1 Tax=Cornus florida TaxID=4283 RepID=UPI002896A78A|nr:beta-amyrin 28-monooxygenase-like [Cornus florida]